MKSFVKMGHTPGLVLRLSESKVEKRTEKIIYPIESFISEFGGAMGLFLGFSFMMIWDVLVFFISCLTVHKKFLISHSENKNV